MYRKCKKENPRVFFRGQNDVAPPIVSILRLYSVQLSDVVRDKSNLQPKK